MKLIKASMHWLLNFLPVKGKLPYTVNPLLSTVLGLGHTKLWFQKLWINKVHR